ncbi:MAG: ArsR/SmtB family transcription factor [Candidatus Dormibacteria bacterium]
MSGELARTILALGDPSRRLLLEELGPAPRTAAQLAERLLTPETVLARCLGELVEAGLVALEPTLGPARYRLLPQPLDQLSDYLRRIAHPPSADIKGVPVERHQDPLSRQGFLVRRELLLAHRRELAFRRFTESIGEWWPLGRWHFGAATPATLTLEARPGGRWYERGEDGTELVWGEVLVLEPPRRLVLSWRLPHPEVPGAVLLTEVDVGFTPVPPSDCRVRVEHRPAGPLGAEARRLQADFGAEDGWTGLLLRFQERLRDAAPAGLRPADPGSAPTPRPRAGTAPPGS